MPLTTIPLCPPGEHIEGLGFCVSCDRHPATTLVLDDDLSPILGDDSEGAEFGVCSLCAEVVFPNSPRVVPSQCVADLVVPTSDGG